VIRLALAGGYGGESLTLTLASADRFLIRVPAARRDRAADATSEGRLIREAQSGSEEAIEQLFRNHWPKAWRAAYLVVHDGPAAEDIAQEAFLAAIRSLDRFDRRRPFGPWLHRIVVNRAIDFTRARTLRREVAADAAEAHGASPDAPSLPYSDDVVAALTSLPAEHRAIVVMRYLLEFTPGEIANALELPRGTVNSRLRRSLDRLGAHLGEGL
jgi:RNA polymerase sigma-70 factor (ECF subfamily)